jgi:quercetin dioxygenase-like cupin family protein
MQAPTVSRASSFFFRHDAQPKERTYELQPPRTIYPLLKTAHLDFGVEEVAVGSEIPWHQHDDKEEVIFVWRGHGQAFIEAGEGTLD